MSSLTKISPTVGDINFEFNDSCNCCCWGRRRTPKFAPGTQVYVNQKGEVKRFDPKKAKDVGGAMQRAVKNLKNVVSNYCDLSESDKKKVFEKIKTRSNLKLKGSEKLDLEKVNSINRVLRDEFSRKS